DADHLTSLYLPRFETPVAGALAGSVELMRRLRNECPWDRAQDHASLRSFLIEEAYEVLDALDRIVELRHDAGPGTGDDSAAGPAPDVVHVDTETLDAYADLESELGDLLFQILFHARLAAEAGQFDMGDVARTLIDKMVGRHPHVFGDRGPTLFTRPDPSAEFGKPDEHQWEQLKAEQVNRHSVLDGIPRSMPSLARSAKVLKRMTNSYGPPETGRWLGSVLAADPTTEDIGSLLVAVVELARRQQVDPEFALRKHMDELERTFRGFETGEIDPSPGAWVVG
ncbi:MAG: hypothetical protein OER95_17740, partial [Acidimicrobiia bacterium]|nr:hypothetical protein [Acidimicrobiia bacterium]